ncbi:MAG: acyl-CoA thioesterase [Planctomycetota bacterium]
MTELVMPNDTNALGNCMGGRVMHLIDIAAAIAARRHTNTTCVTAAIDEIVFHEPVPMGSVIALHASVNLACRTSMEVGVRVEMESMKSGDRLHCATAYLTFVALDETGRPMPIPKLTTESDLDRRREEQARRRRTLRLERMGRKPRS